MSIERERTLPRIMIAGTNSGCGKTTVSCGLLKALKDRELQVSAFKCGPDYIDPMFHEKIIGLPSFNLDVFLTDEETVKYLLAESVAPKGMAVMEGAMGFYDGMGYDTSYASPAHLSDITDTPVILVVNCKGMSLSAGAMVQGFKTFRENKISGVILNHASKRIFPAMKKSIEESTGLPVFGYLPEIPEAKLESRHLGLITAQEIEGLQSRLDRLGICCRESIDIDAIVKLAKTATPLKYNPINIKPLWPEKKKIAVAYDKAFCFYYNHNFLLLEKLGASIEFFSPLSDRVLPKNISGLILGGGYPEIYAQTLSRNRKMLEEIRQAIQGGLPTIAECGGFMYLHENMCGYTMVGVIKGEADMTQSLTRFGYIKIKARKDCLLCEKGGEINAHEFHYSDSTNPGKDFDATKPRSGHAYVCGHANENLYAGYPHLHLWGNIEFARNFVRKLV